MKPFPTIAEADAHHKQQAAARARAREKEKEEQVHALKFREQCQGTNKRELTDTERTGLADCVRERKARRKPRLIVAKP